MHLSSVATTLSSRTCSLSLSCLSVLLQAIISGLRESVQSFQSEVTDVNSKEVMDLLVLTQVMRWQRVLGCAGG